jgi:hypothetical protein
VTPRLLLTLTLGLPLALTPELPLGLHPCNAFALVASPRLGLRHGEYVLSTPRNFNLTPKFATSFCPSYVAAQEAHVAPRVSATRQVIQANGLAFGSSPITKARGARIIMPQYFRPLNMEEERTLLARGEETTTPQAVKASNSCVPGIHVH